jgi:hypothetical protein
LEIISTLGEREVLRVRVRVVEVEVDVDVEGRPTSVRTERRGLGAAGGEEVSGGEYHQQPRAMGC